MHLVFQCTLWLIFISLPVQFISYTWVVVPTFQRVYNKVCAPVSKCLLCRAHDPRVMGLNPIPASYGFTHISRRCFRRHYKYGAPCTGSCAHASKRPQEVWQRFQLTWTPNFDIERKACTSPHLVTSKAKSMSKSKAEHILSSGLTSMHCSLEMDSLIPRVWGVNDVCSHLSWDRWGQLYRQ